MLTLHSWCSLALLPTTSVCSNVWICWPRYCSNIDVFGLYLPTVLFQYVKLQFRPPKRSWTALFFSAKKITCMFKALCFKGHSIGSSLNIAKEMTCAFRTLCFMSHSIGLSLNVNPIHWVWSGMCSVGCCLWDAGSTKVYSRMLSVN